MTKLEYANYEARVAAFMEREQLSFVTTENIDPFFSWSTCECCEAMAGSRTVLTARAANGETVRYNVCRDCEYYVTYGRLDDATMQGVR